MLLYLLIDYSVGPLIDSCFSFGDDKQVPRSTSNTVALKWNSICYDAYAQTGCARAGCPASDRCCTLIQNDATSTVSGRHPAGGCISHMSDRFSPFSRLLTDANMHSSILAWLCEDTLYKRHKCKCVTQLSLRRITQSVLFWINYALHNIYYLIVSISTATGHQD